MPCAAPIPAWRPANGGSLTFNQPRDGRAYSPIKVPCGTCILCREEQARQWAVRITHEAQQYEQSSFVTLSYSDENIPTHGSLNYADLQKFWKRLRKAVGRLRYYAVGEYGDKSFRPHYHACIFGHAFINQRIILRTTPTLLWTCPTLQKAWGLGHVSVGALTFQSARYTASYVTKKLRSKQVYVRTDHESGELIPIVQPRPFMSRNIGKQWWEQWRGQVIDHDYVIINAQKQKPPKAYDKWLKALDPDKHDEIKAARLEHAEPLTDEQLRAKAIGALALKNSQQKII